MLHEKLITGNFLHHVQKDSNTHEPPIDVNLYNAYRYAAQMHQQQQLEQVLDLSRRCDSVETPPRKTPSPSEEYNNNSEFPTTTKCDTSSVANTLAANIHKLYTSNNSTSSLNSLLTNNTILGSPASLYPFYYPNIKSERDTSPKLNTPKLSPSSSTPDQSNLPHSNNSSLYSTLTMPSATSPKSAQNEYNENLSPQSSKLVRPFKAFPRDPQVIAASFVAADMLYENSREKYVDFRKRCVDHIYSANGGERTISNPKMRRLNTRCNPDARSPSSASEERLGESASDNDSNAPSTSHQDLVSNDNDDSNNRSCSSGMIKDAAYYERRKKNNAAAKKSRDRRRIKEDELAMRTAFLERQNIELLCQSDAAKAEVNRLTSEKTDLLCEINSLKARISQLTKS